MAFLDNSGDIILDAVLTDTGRLRLAQGDGSFKIAKFALGDDEINYALYNKNHSSGSAYYDLEVLQTPVLEAFTNNTSNLKTKLITISRTNILFMPILKINSNLNDNNPVAGVSNSKSSFFTRHGSSAGAAAGYSGGAGSNVSDNKFYVAVDEDTMKVVHRYRNVGDDTQLELGGTGLGGMIQGYTPTNLTERSDFIRVDQGIDSNQLAPSLQLDSDLLESAFVVEMDYRLGRVKPVDSNTPKAVNFIDDDSIAQYYLTQKPYVNPKVSLSNQQSQGSYKKTDLDGAGNAMVFEGPRGNTCQFRLEASQELKSSTYLFTQIGQEESVRGANNILGLPTDASNLDPLLPANKKIYYIDSIVRVVGANTGYRLDIPVRYVKIA